MILKKGFRFLARIFTARVVSYLHFGQIGFLIGWFVVLAIYGRSAYPWWVAFAWWELFVLAHLSTFTLLGAIMSYKKAMGYEVEVNFFLPDEGPGYVWPIDWRDPRKILPEPGTDLVFKTTRTGLINIGYFERAEDDYHNPDLLGVFHGQNGRGYNLWKINDWEINGYVYLDDLLQFIE